MNDRDRALAILREAREIIAQRLTERVLEVAEEILDDARGDSYMGEIETLYEQVGMRMVHLSQMISHLPEVVEPPPAPAPNEAADDYFSVATDPSSSMEAFVADTMPALLGPIYMATPALPAPVRRGESLDAPATFQSFASQVNLGDLPAAARSLGQLLGMSEGRAQRCAVHFAERIQHDPHFLRKVMQLRTELEDGGEHGVLVLLHQCFGLAGLDAVTVLNFLRQRLGG